MCRTPTHHHPDGRVPPSARRRGSWPPCLRSAKLGLTGAWISATGKVIWHVDALPHAPCTYFGDRPLVTARAQRVLACRPNHGHRRDPGRGLLRPRGYGWFQSLHDAASGKVIWGIFHHPPRSTTRSTVLKAQQPAAASTPWAPVVANGMVYVFSGYSGASGTGGNPRNVLLAFSVVTASRGLDDTLPVGVPAALAGAPSDHDKPSGRRPGAGGRGCVSPSTAPTAMTRPSTAQASTAPT